MAHAISRAPRNTSFPDLSQRVKQKPLHSLEGEKGSQVYNFLVRRLISILDRNLGFPFVHVYQAKPRGIASQVNGAVKAELFHEVAAVVLNRFGANEKLV